MIAAEERREGKENMTSSNGTFCVVTAAFLLIRAGCVHCLVTEVTVWVSYYFLTFLLLLVVIEKRMRVIE
jgi:hypothetical protein